MKKLIKSKFIFCIVVFILASSIYLGIQRMIDMSEFRNNTDVISLIEEEEKEDTEQQEFHDDTNFMIEEPEKNELENIEEDSKNKILVYITGEVNNPGVVILDEGSRIIDAINASGGVTQDADISKVNLVFILEDGMKVNIPNSEDLKKKFEYITRDSGDGGNDSSDTKVFSNKSEEMSNKYDVVNINTATQTELETLPGIGPSLALNIINYRKENGKFSSIEQIKNVSGIGDSKFEKLKNYISI